jgi:hypothetical protein
VVGAQGFHLKINIQRGGKKGKFFNASYFAFHWGEQIKEAVRVSIRRHQTQSFFEDIHHAYL